MAVHEKDEDHIKENQIYPDKHPCSEKDREKDLVGSLQKNITVFSLLCHRIRRAHH